MTEKCYAPSSAEWSEICPKNDFRPERYDFGDFPGKKTKHGSKIDRKRCVGQAPFTDQKRFTGQALLSGVKFVPKI